MPSKMLMLAVVALLLLSACKKNQIVPGISFAKTTYTLPGDSLFPEGIAFQPSTGYMFTGSTYNGDIVRVDVQTGAKGIWATGASQNRKAATGMKLDGMNHLWVCGGDDNKVSVLDTNAALIKSWDLKAMFGSGFINDCASDGTYMYFTDSKVQKIYRATISASPVTMESWLSFTAAQIPYDSTAINANGIVVTPDNKYLIIVVSSSGKLYRISIADKSITEISLNTALTNGDGMVISGQTLYVSRNAANVVVPVSLSAAFDKGTAGDGFGTILNFNTTMAKAGVYLLVVNGQLNKRATKNPTLPFTISRITIP